MRKKIFLLGVGAQKAGTTWLHNQLVQNSNVDMGFRKEYHVFDAIFSEECISFRNELINNVFEKVQKGELGKNSNESSGIARRLSFIDNTENYFDYFDYLYLKNPFIEMVGDITPSYSMLNANVYQHIKQGLESRGFSVKVVFITRDPIDRIWSMLRMGRRDKVNGGGILLKTEEELLKIWYKLPEVQVRTRYEHTMLNLEKVFYSEDIYYGFYESFFTKHSFLSLKSFLGVNLIEPDFEEKVNSSPKNEAVSEDLMSEIAHYYSETYNYSFEKFGLAVKDIWLGYNYL